MINTSKYNKPSTMLKGLWNSLCLFVVCGMVGVFCFWLGQPNYYYAITPSDIYPHVVSSTGGEYHPNIIISGVGTGTFSQWIVNSEGKTVYEYPVINLSSDENTTVRQQRITIPALPPGLYGVRCRLTSRPNPIKQYTVSITMGLIQVEGNDKIRNPSPDEVDKIIHKIIPLQDRQVINK